VQHTNGADTLCSDAAPRATAARSVFTHTRSGAQAARAFALRAADHGPPSGGRSRRQAQRLGAFSVATFPTLRRRGTVLRPPCASTRHLGSHSRVPSSDRLQGKGRLHREVACQRGLVRQGAGAGPIGYSTAHPRCRDRALLPARALASPPRTRAQSHVARGLFNLWSGVAMTAREPRGATPSRAPHMAQNSRICLRILPMACSWSWRIRSRDRLYLSPISLRVSSSSLSRPNRQRMILDSMGVRVFSSR